MKLFKKLVDPSEENNSGSTSFKPMSELAMKNTRGGDAGDGQGDDGSGGDGGSNPPPPVETDDYDGGPEGYTPGVLYPVDGGIWFNGQFYTFPYDDFPVGDLPDPDDSSSGAAGGPESESETGTDYAVYTGGETNFPTGKIVPVEDGVWFNGEHYAWPFEDFPFQELSADGGSIYDPGNDPLDGGLPGETETSDNSGDAWDDGNVGPEDASEFYALLFDSGFEPVIDAPIDEA